MDAILQQKRKGQAQFRIQIDNFLSNSIFTRQQDQLSLQVIQEIFSSSPQQGLITNGRVNLQRLIQVIQDSGQHFNIKQFSSIFGNKKQLKIQQIHQMLRGHDLSQFDFQQQITKNFFENEKFSMGKLDKVMKQLGYNELNRKDKQILIQCFDYNRDNNINRKDLESLLDRAVEGREKKKVKVNLQNQEIKAQKKESI